MAAILPSGAVFLHVPKTGGSWVMAVLKDQNLLRTYVKPKHVSAYRYREFFRHHPELYLYYCLKHGPLWHHATKDTFRFFFVRHPLSWYESLWTYMSGRSWQPFPERPSRLSTAWHPKSLLHQHASEDFNLFVSRVAEAYPGFVTNLYHYYDAIPATYVGRQESLADDLVEVLTLLNERFDEDRIRNFPRVNESVTTRRPEWDPDLRQRVMGLEHAALVKYGYVRDARTSTAGEPARSPRGESGHGLGVLTRPLGGRTHEEPALHR